MASGRQALARGSVFWISHARLLDLGVERVHEVWPQSRRDRPYGCNQLANLQGELRLVLDSQALFACEAGECFSFDRVQFKRTGEAKHGLAWRCRTL